MIESYSGFVFIGKKVIKTSFFSSFYKNSINNNYIIYWEKRWFYINAGRLFYYDNESSFNNHGIEKWQATLFGVEMINNNNKIIELNFANNDNNDDHDHKEILYLKFIDDDDYQMWKDAIFNHISYANSFEPFVKCQSRVNYDSDYDNDDHNNIIIDNSNNEIDNTINIDNNNKNNNVKQEKIENNDTDYKQVLKEYEKNNKLSFVPGFVIKSYCEIKEEKNCTDSISNDESEIISNVPFTFLSKNSTMDCKLFINVCKSRDIESKILIGKLYDSIDKSGNVCYIIDVLCNSISTNNELNIDNNNNEIEDESCIEILNAIQIVRKIKIKSTYKIIKVKGNYYNKNKIENGDDGSESTKYTEYIHNNSDVDKNDELYETTVDNFKNNNNNNNNNDNNNQIQAITKSSMSILIEKQYKKTIPLKVINHIGVIALIKPSRIGVSVKGRPLLKKDTTVFACARFRSNDSAEWLKVKQGWIMDKPQGNAVRIDQLFDFYLPFPPSEIKIISHKVINPSSMAISTTSSSSSSITSSITSSFLFNNEREKDFETHFLIELRWLSLQIHLDSLHNGDDKDSIRKISKCFHFDDYKNEYCVVRIWRTFEELSKFVKLMKIAPSILPYDFPHDMDGNEELFDNIEDYLQMIQQVQVWLSGLAVSDIDITKSKDAKTFFFPNAKDKHAMDLMLSNDNGLDGAWSEALTEDLFAIQRNSTLLSERLSV